MKRRRFVQIGSGAAVGLAFPGATISVARSLPPVPAEVISRLQVATAKDFLQVVVDLEGAAGGHAGFDDLQPDTTYYWRQLVRTTGDFHRIYYGRLIHTQSDDLASLYDDELVPFAQEAFGSQGVGTEESELPRSASLGQNYPNPFSGTTTVTFRIDRAGRVRIDVFNLLGQHVSTLVNTELRAGNHEVRWDSGDAASGTYVYVMETEHASLTRQLILMK